MDFQPKTLKCTECGVGFIFSAGEQEFFNMRNLVNEPKRCPNCRLMLRFARTGKDITQLSEVQCADCGQLTKVPFKPRGIKPIYCIDCLAVHKTSGQGHFDDSAVMIGSAAAAAGSA